MPSQPLGQVVDVEAASRLEGAHVVVAVRVPRAWLARGEAIEIDVEAPERARCARCEGGGCDACERSGGVRLSPDPAARTFTVTLPASLAEVSALRVPRPFGEGSPVGLVVCEVQLGEEAERCRLRAPAPSARAPLPPVAWLAPVAAVLAALAWALLGR